MPNEHNEQLYRAASQKLGVTPEAIRAAAEAGDLSALSGKVDIQALNAVLNDQNKLQQMLNSPQAQMLLKKLTEGK